MSRASLALIAVVAGLLLSLQWPPAAEAERARANRDIQEEVGTVPKRAVVDVVRKDQSEPEESPLPDSETLPLMLLVSVADHLGAPLPDARVLFLPEIGTPLEGRSDLSGSCLLRSDNPARGMVRAEFMDRAEEVADVFVSGIEPTVVRLQFQKWISIQVRVEDTSGAPISDSQVTLGEHLFVHYPDRPVQRPMSRRTDEHGFADFPHVGGASFQVLVTKQGYFASRKGYRAGYEEPHLVVVVMEPGEQVTIRALSDRDNQPVANVGIYVNYDVSMRQASTRAPGIMLTNDAGEVQFSRPVGTGGSCFVPSDFEWTGAMSLPPHENLVTLRLSQGEAARCRIRIAGTHEVITAPCTLQTKKGFRGLISSEAVFPDQDGLFAVEHQGNVYSPFFRFELPGVGFTSWKSLSNKSMLGRPVELEMRPYSVVNLIAFSVASNAPVSGARIEVREIERDSESFLESPHSRVVSSTTTDDQGQGVLHVHGEGHYEVMVDGGASLGRAWRTIDFARAPGLDLGRVILDGRGSLDLSIVHSGRPAAFYHGWLVSDSLGEPGGRTDRYRFRTGADGRALVTGLSLQTYRILISGPSVRPPVTVPSGWRMAPNPTQFLVSVTAGGPVSFTAAIP